ncbi:MAG: monovalent cation/H(+) antiporter subunit G [Actinomycetota bacterium]|nr:monovalent cation/H(+) antiporter subunit G [Actinomycetota bacterium]
MRLAATGLIGLGAALMLLAGVGVVRLPDVFSRMHAGTKAASLGLACVLTGAAILVSDPVATVKVLLAILFQFVTAPVAAHAIGRAAYRAGVPMWEGTRYDELGGRAPAED